ncbi:MAG: hypothetical protein JNM38_10900 [Acidobacteria bacterium]|nr:hypothetical protein [Acidobacteriota bacterium]
MTRRRLDLLFRVAAGPRLGFGHLVRAARLARSAGIAGASVSIRGNAGALEVARRLGLRPVTTSLAEALTRTGCRTLVVDDPGAAAARAAVATARRQGVTTVSIHDLGIAPAGADVGIDGSAAPGRRPPGTLASLVGLRYAILDPRCEATPAPRRRRGHVLVALGGGPRTAGAVALARAIAARTAVPVVVALGFGGASPAALPPGVTCVSASDGLIDLLRGSAVAVTAGGVTALEAAACATPVVATPVDAAQRPTVTALARAGAAIDGGRFGRQRVAAIATEVARLLANAPRRAQMGRAGRNLVDGKGAARVVDAIRRWQVSEGTRT